ncbi:hypothetical protein [Aestuariivirga sp.]|uniref:hypothetical protein n=1 Tax=Aestuariivirga sp. TaxID=2650926 RepID=UPI0039E5B121
MKAAFAALFIFVAGICPALADDCAKDIAKIDQAMAKPDAVKPEDRAQLEDMRNQAVQLCGAGNTQEGLDVTGEAKAMLNIQ